MLKAFIQRAIQLAAVEASKTPLARRAAERAVDLERRMNGEKAGLWVGAACREVYSDINSSWNQARSFLKGDTAAETEKSTSTAAQQKVDAGSSFNASPKK